MQKRTIKLTFERTTKNTVRYKEEPDEGPPIIGALYIQQWAVGNPVPHRLVVTIEEA
jgi:hypothetical protein